MVAPIETQTTLIDTIEYPSSDGQPMSDNTLQFRWIVTIEGGLDALYSDNPNVFVAGDLLWYPVQGKPTIRMAPDAMVAFGRPKGERGSYLQWLEDNIPPQVVFEVLSPGNRAGEMARKFAFYERYGVEEYYIYDPDRVLLTGWQRSPGGSALAPIAEMDGWMSPRLGIRFVLGQAELELYRPDGRKFPTYLELDRQAMQGQQAAVQAQQAVELAEQAVQQAQQATIQAQQAVELAEQVATQAQQAVKQAEQVAAQERQTAIQERQRAERLAAQLRALGIDPDQT